MKTTILLAAVTGAATAALTISLPALALTEADKTAVKVDFRQNFGAEFVATVDLGEARYRFVTVVPDFASSDAGIARQKALSGWKGDYLFVRQQCGSAQEWRCVVDQVFTRQGDRLVHLGSVESARCEQPGCRYDPATGVFSDIYDGLQVNPATGQVDTPPLQVARRVSGTALVADADLTWARNQDLYASGMACLDQVAVKGFEPPCAGGMNAWTGLVFAAKLTHYTGRQAERAALFQKQAVSYCQRSADPRCTLRVNGVKEHFAGFAPGALPRYIPSAVRLTTTREQEGVKPAAEPLAPAKPISLKLAQP